MSAEAVLTQPAAVKDETSELQMSYEEYLAWTGEDVHAEWVDGEVIIHMPPKKLHQLLVGFLDRVIGIFVAVFDLGIVQVAPFEVRLGPDGPSREPDLLFLSKAHSDRLTSERLAGSPDLIVEVVSDDSVHRDRVDKFDEYEAAGVPEYWVIDNRPEQRRVWFFQLDATGRYQSVPTGADSVYRSAMLPGFELRVEWLWQEEPDVLGALAALIGPERFAEALRAAERAE